MRQHPRAGVDYVFQSDIDCGFWFFSFSAARFGERSSRCAL
jgi:hypothetical protein